MRDTSVDPYAHIVWPAALAAARTLARIMTESDVVLDVGAGTGLCALTAATLGGRAIALDRDAASLERISLAARVNAVVVEVVHCDIGTGAALPACSIAVFADLLYEVELARIAARRVLEVLANGGIVIVADPGRAARVALDRVLEEHNVAVAYEDIRVQLPGDTPATIQVAVIR